MAAVQITEFAIKTRLLRRENGLLPHNVRQLRYAAPALLPNAIVTCRSNNCAAGEIAEIKMAFVVTQDFYAHCVTLRQKIATVYGEKRMGIDARVMAWQTAPQNVGISGITASIHGRKKWRAVMPIVSQQFSFISRLLTLG